MLIPQYSLRRLLAITTGCAVVFSIFGVAIRGSLVAAAVSAGVLALVAMMLVYAAVFGVIWLVSLALPRIAAVSSTGVNPFQADEVAAEPILLE